MTNTQTLTETLQQQPVTITKPETVPVTVSIAGSTVTNVLTATVNGGSNNNGGNNVANSAAEIQSAIMMWSGISGAIGLIIGGAAVFALHRMKMRQLQRKAPYAKQPISHFTEMTTSIPMNSFQSFQGAARSQPPVTSDGSSSYFTQSQQFQSPFTRQLMNANNNSRSNLMQYK